MSEQSTKKSEVPEQWGQSSASKLTMSGYLPKNSESHPVPSLPHENASRRGEEILQLVRFSGEELGRDSKLRMLYIRAMGEQFASVDFLDRAREATKIVTEITEHGLDIDNQPEEVKAAIIEDINNLNVLSERVWGRVEPERFSAMVARLRRKARAALADDSTPDHKRLAAQNILLTLPEVDDALAETHDYTPSKELLEAYEPRVRKKYASLLELVPEQEMLDRHTLKSVFEAGIGRMADSWQLDNARNWKVAFGRTNVNVDIETSTVWIPETYADITRLKAEQLMVHEIGGHLLRNLLGEKTGDSFMATHLPGRRGEEEGLLATLESTLSGERREAGVQYYLAIGLGRDVLGTGNTPDTDELRDIMTDISILNTGKTVDKARAAATKQVHRVMRGMPSVVIDGKRHQAIWTDDLKYAIGQEHAVQWMEANKDNPAALDEVMTGKYAYSEQQQAEYAHALYTEKIAGRFAVPSAV